MEAIPLIQRDNRYTHHIPRHPRGGLVFDGGRETYVGLPIPIVAALLDQRGKAILTPLLNGELKKRGIVIATEPVWEEPYPIQITQAQAGRREFRLGGIGNNHTERALTALALGEFAPQLDRERVVRVSEHSGLLSERSVQFTVVTGEMGDLLAEDRSRRNADPNIVFYPGDEYIDLTGKPISSENYVTMATGYMHLTITLPYDMQVRAPFRHHKEGAFNTPFAVMSGGRMLRDNEQICPGTKLFASLIGSSNADAMMSAKSILVISGSGRDEKISGLFYQPPNPRNGMDFPQLLIVDGVGEIVEANRRFAGRIGHQIVVRMGENVI